jgi:hypothetical protein
VRLVVDPWDPAYGTSAEGDLLGDAEPKVELGVERGPLDWAPVLPRALDPLDALLFVDGVRRVDARVWIGGDEGPLGTPGLCASWAAGVVRCSPGRAELVAATVGRGLFSASPQAEDLATRYGTFRSFAARATGPDALPLALQDAMAATEAQVAEASVAAAAADPLVTVPTATGLVRTAGTLTVLDGPLRGRQHLAATVGLVKTHHVAYLEGDAGAVLAALAPGERTPVFLVATSWARFSWYLRLPGAPRSSAAGVAPLAGVVRCECAADLAVEDAVALAERTAFELPRFASEAHKDARAPQNLYPIGGLERHLRRRLGDARLLYRALRIAAR